MKAAMREKSWFEAMSMTVAGDGSITFTSYGAPDGNTAVINITHLDNYWQAKWTREHVIYSLPLGGTIIPTSGGGYLVAGCKTGAPTVNMFANVSDGAKNVSRKGLEIPRTWIAKLDADGRTKWEHLLEVRGNRPFSPVSVIQTSDGGSLAAWPVFSASYSNRKYGGGVNDIYISRFGPGGNIIWHTAYTSDNDDEVHSIIEYSPGNYEVAIVSDFGLSLNIIRYNDKGKLTGEKNIVSLPGGVINAVEPTSDGGYIVTGDKGDSANALLLKVSNDYRVEWKKTFGGESYDRGKAVKEMSDGGFLMLAYTSSFGACHTKERSLCDFEEGATWPQNVNLMLIRTDSRGEMEWGKVIGGAGNDRPVDLEVTGNTIYVLGNKDDKKNDNRYMFILKFDEGSDCDFQL